MSGRRLALGAAGWLVGIVSSVALSNVAASSSKSRQASEMFLFDFTTANSVADWSEMSDVVRTVGMSKAALTLQKTQVFQRAIFFSLLNPQPNGAGFAGVRTSVQLDLTPYRTIKMKARVQGQNLNYKMVLRHKGETGEPFPTYEKFFTAKPNEFEEIDLPLSEFVAYYRGKPVADADPLDLSQITAVGLQVYGGVYSEQKQSGPGSMEIDWIKAL
ncbi:uncharacterized protein LOC132193467 [Neocloeon triangulifer]|uniref:uncharacterized protein LOC132193467 n=1 Tax=Neocloeon triangulifer TaxID=2078957 RepID=UPI00286ED21B|nr:uncharacterized protein LOC132193467 [Neocloeon triangulifer]